MPADRPALSVVLPVYNESERIAASVLHVSGYLRTAYPDHEILTVDDGSSDDTRAILERLAREVPRLRVLSYWPNRGKGYAVRQGFQAAQGEWIAVVDSDLEIPIESLPRFFEVQRESSVPVVVGSKRHPDSRVETLPTRRRLSVGYAVLTRLLFRLPVRDTQVGFKLFRRDSISLAVQCLLVKRFAFDLEILVVQQRLGFAVAEAPIEIRFSRAGGGRIRERTVANIARETLGIWFRRYVTHFYDRAIGNASGPVVTAGAPGPIVDG